MAWHIRDARKLAMGIGTAGGMLGLGGCIMGADRPEKDQTEVSASAMVAPAAARMGNANPGSRYGWHWPLRQACRPPEHGGGGSVTRVLFTENWDLFDGGLWSGDGDQWVADGLFSAGEGAESATADWLPGEAGVIDGSRTLRFSNELVSARNGTDATSAREALFFISGDTDDAFANYLFVSIRYSAAGGTVSLESYGASGGIEFDQSVDLPWAPQADPRLKLEVEIATNAYRILLDGEAVDDIALGTALNRVRLFEVGVQSGPEGMLGLIDRTTISLDSALGSGGTGCRKGGFGIPYNCHQPAKGGHWRARAKMAKAKLAHCAKPSRGMQALARIRK